MVILGKELGAPSPCLIMIGFYGPAQIKVEFARVDGPLRPVRPVNPCIIISPLRVRLDVS